MTTPLERAAPKWFPVQTTPYQGDSAFVPWDFVAPHDARCKRNHSQSLARLAERGGLSWGELLDVLTDQPYAHHMAARQLTNAEAAQHVMTMLIEWLRPPAPSEAAPVTRAFSPDGLRAPEPAPSEAATAGEQSEANKALVREARAIGRSLSRPVSDEATMRIGVAPADRLTVALREAAERATVCATCGGRGRVTPSYIDYRVDCEDCGGSGRATGGGT